MRRWICLIMDTIVETGELKRLSRHGHTSNVRVLRCPDLTGTGLPRWPRPCGFKFYSCCGINTAVRCCAIRSNWQQLPEA